ncbi:hypothetical protein QX51_15420 [Terrisporobacter othiniensis]|uniref:Holin n=1 Tax=Terrisporobacter othiniensis TaxID=1577792 RepID=A0A0B3VTL9_9FIRM|nr:phage holin family protein [Terrisporobacter othiniensis]KHS56153.1 hypothetical protein QX51_15420 [Terrisporobacter othiniensis]
MGITLEVLFKVFFVGISIDFIAGILAAAKEGGLKSRRCSEGMFRSFGECIVLGIFIALDYFIPQISAYIGTFIIGFIFKEGLSIIENLVRLDVWVPNSIKKALEVGANKVDKLEKVEK